LASHEEHYHRLNQRIASTEQLAQERLTLYETIAAQLAEREQDLETLENETASLRELASMAKDYPGRVAQNETTIKALQASNLDLTTKLAASSEHSVRAQQKIASLQEQIQQITSQNETEVQRQQQLLQKSESQVSLLSQRVQELTARGDLSIDRCSELAQVKSQLEETRLRVRHYESVLVQKEEQLVKAEASSRRCSEAAEELSRLRAYVARLEIEVDRGRGELDGLRDFKRLHMDCEEKLLALKQESHSLRCKFERSEKLERYLEILSTSERENSIIGSSLHDGNSDIASFDRTERQCLRLAQKSNQLTLSLNDAVTQLRTLETQLKPFAENKAALEKSTNLLALARNKIRDLEEAYSENKAYLNELQLAAKANDAQRLGFMQQLEQQGAELKKLYSSKHQADELTEQLKQALLARTSAEEQNLRSTQKLLELQNQFQQAQTGYSEGIAHCKQLESQLADLKQRHDQTSAELRDYSGSTTSLSHLRKANEELREEVKVLHNRCRELDVESSKARAQVLTNTENIRHLNEKLEATKEPLREARANEQELLRIKPHLDFSQKQVASLTSELSSTQELLRNACAEQQAVTQELFKLRAQISSSEVTLDRFRNEIRELNETKQDLAESEKKFSQSMRESEEARNKIKDDLQESRVHVQSLTMRLERAVADKDHQQSAYDMLLQAHKILEGKHNQLESTLQLNNERYATSNEALKECKRDLENSRKEIIDVRSRMEQMQTKNSQLESKLASLGEMQNALISKEATLATGAKELATLKSSVDQERQSSQNLKQEHNLLQQEVQKLDLKGRRLEAQLTDSEAARAAAIQTNAAMQEKIKSLKDVKDKLSESCRQYVAQIDKLTHQYDASKYAVRELETMRTSHFEARETVQRLELSVKALQSQEELSKKQFEALQAAHKLLQDQHHESLEATQTARDQTEQLQRQLKLARGENEQLSEVLQKMSVLQKRIQELENGSELRLAQQTVSELNQKCKELRSEISTRDFSHQSLSLKLTEVEHKFNAAAEYEKKFNISATKCQALETSISELIRKCDELTCSSREAHMEKANQSALTSRFEKQVAEQNAQLEKTLALLEQSRNREDAVKAELREIEVAVRDLRSKEISLQSYQHQKSELEKKLQIAISEISNLKSSESKQHQLVSSLEIKVHDLTNQLTAVKHQAHEATNRIEEQHAWKMKMSERDAEKLLEDAKRESELQMDSIRHQQRGLAQQLESALKAEAAAKEELANVNAKIIDFERLVADQKAENQLLPHLKEQIASLQHQNREMSTKVSECIRREEDIKDLTRKRERLEEVLAETNKRHQSWQDATETRHVRIMEKEQEDFERRYAQLQQKYITSKDQLRDSQKSLNAMTDRFKDSEDTIQQLRSNEVRLTSSLHASQGELQQAALKMQMIEQTTEALRKQIESLQGTNAIVLQGLRKIDVQFNSRYATCLSGGLTNAPAMFESLMNENLSLKQEAGRLDAETAQMRRDLDALLAAQNLAQQRNTGGLNISASRSATLDLLARSPEYLRTQCEMLAEHKKRLAVKFLNAQQEIAALKKALVEAQGVSTQLEQAQSDIAGLQASISETGQRSCLLAEELQRGLDREVQLQKELTSLRSEVALEQREKQEAHRRVRDYSEEARARDAQVKFLVVYSCLSAQLLCYLNIILAR
jgi:chromosome segregation ATPase